MTKYVFVTGGLVGSTGKGIATASIERVPKSRIGSGTLQKMLPDLDVDLDMLRSKIDKYDISANCPRIVIRGVILKTRRTDECK